MHRTRSLSPRAPPLSTFQALSFPTKCLKCLSFPPGRLHGRARVRGAVLGARRGRDERRAAAAGQRHAGKALCEGRAGPVSGGGGMEEAVSPLACKARHKSRVCQCAGPAPGGGGVPPAVQEEVQAQAGTMATKRGTQVGRLVEGVRYVLQSVSVPCARRYPASTWACPTTSRSGTTTR